MKRLVAVGAAAVLLAAGGPVWGADPDGVDLVVSDIVPSASEPPKVLVIVRNAGTRPLVRPSVVELRLDDTVLGRGDVPPLRTPGEPAHVEFRRPARMAPGLHNFIARADPDDAVRELSEDNNEYGMSVWVDTAPPAPGGRSQHR